MKLEKNPNQQIKSRNEALFLQPYLAKGREKKAN